ncbi:MAG: hypothetical protein KDD61_05850 [Bdellovibrionales bacterium]|nr:hypothetical protein [Bdellovibrionales bacterium]
MQFSLLSFILVGLIGFQWVAFADDAPVVDSSDTVRLSLSMSIIRNFEFSNFRKEGGETWEMYRSTSQEMPKIVGLYYKVLVAGKDSVPKAFSIPEELSSKLSSSNYFLKIPKRPLGELKVGDPVILADGTKLSSMIISTGNVGGVVIPDIYISSAIKKQFVKLKTAMASKNDSGEQALDDEETVSSDSMGFVTGSAMSFAAPPVISEPQFESESETPEFFLEYVSRAKKNMVEIYGYSVEESLDPKRDIVLSPDLNFAYAPLDIQVLMSVAMASPLPKMWIQMAFPDERIDVSPPEVPILSDVVSYSPTCRIYEVIKPPNGPNELPNDSIKKVSCKQEAFLILTFKKL